VEILDNKTDSELLRSLIGELAKSRNELNCAQADLQKATSRLGFLLVLANELTARLNNKSDDYK
jgi:hypothetical protein